LAKTKKQQQQQQQQFSKTSELLLDNKSRRGKAPKINLNLNLLNTTISLTKKRKQNKNPLNSHHSLQCMENSNLDIDSFCSTKINHVSKDKCIFRPNYSYPLIFK